MTARANDVLITKKPFKVLVCLATLVAFLCNTLLFDAALLRPLGFVGQAWAVETPSMLTGRGVDRADGSGSLKELHVDTFTLPEYLGRIKDSWKGNTDKIVIHIQDAHCNYAAQRKISEIIAYLNKQYGVDIVNLEGGAKGYDLAIFTDINDKAIRDKVSDYFVKEGLVNGAEYFAINNPEKISLWGIEDTKLYLDNLNIYRDSLKHKDEVDKHLNVITHILNNLKTKIYSQELLDLDNKYSQYKAGNLAFKDYLAHIIQTAKKDAIDIKPLTNICLLNQTLEEETNIDFKKANIQRDDLIDKLQKKLSKKRIEELVLKTVEFKAEKISQKDFYSYLSDKAKQKDLSLDDFPELKKYIAYVSMYDAIDKTKTMDELEKLEDSIKETLFKNDEQRKLDRLSKNLAILKNIFNISLTKDDYKYYTDNKESFSAANYASFINRETPLCKISAQLDKNISDLDYYRENISKFYEYSFKRDDVFVKNIKLTYPSLRGVPPKVGRRSNLNNAAIVVTGGFHAENLCEKFKKEGISYISIMPNFKNCDGYECPYFGLLSGKKFVNIKVTLPSVLNSTLAIPDQLSPEMMRAMDAAGIASDSSSTTLAIGAGQTESVQESASQGPESEQRKGRDRLSSSGDAEEVSRKYVKLLLSLEDKLGNGGVDSKSVADAAIILRPAYAALIDRGKKVDYLPLEAAASAAGLVPESLIYVSLFNRGEIDLDTLEAKFDNYYFEDTALSPVYVTLFKQGKIDLVALEKKADSGNFCVRKSALTARGHIYALLIEQRKITLAAVRKKIVKYTQVGQAAVLGPVYVSLITRREMRLSELEAKLRDSDWHERTKIAIVLCSVYASLVEQGSMSLSSFDAKMAMAKSLDRGGSSHWNEVGSAHSEILSPLYASLVNQGKMPLSELEAKSRSRDWHEAALAYRAMGLFYTLSINKGNITDEYIEKYLLWQSEHFPYYDNMVDEYLNSIDPKAHISKLKRSAERLINNGFSYKNEEECRLAFMATRANGINIGFDQFLKKIKNLEKFDNAHNGYFRKLFDKAKGLSPLEVSATISHQLDTSQVDIKVLDKDLARSLSVKERIDSLDWLGDFAGSKALNLQNLYYQLKRAETGVGAEERFHVEYPEERAMRREILDNKALFYRVVFKLASMRLGEKELRDKYLNLMLDLIVSDVLRDNDLVAAMRSRDNEMKIAAFKSFYEDYKNHLPDSVGLTIEKIKGLTELIEKRSGDAYTELNKARIATREAADTYKLIPQGFLSVFRGRANIIDCSFDEDKGAPYTRAMHEDTMYYFVYKGKELKGYIGLMKTKTANGQNVLIVDTINSPSMDGEELLTNLLRALAGVAVKLGCVSVALPDDLGPSFNFDNEDTLAKMELYKKGQKTQVAPLHCDTWVDFAKMFGTDIYNSIEDGQFRLINVSKAPRLSSSGTPSPAPNLVDDIIPLAKEAKIDRTELVKAVKEKIAALVGEDQSNGPGVIRSILSAISGLEQPMRSELQMAIRTAVMVDSLGAIDKTEHVNIIVQIAVAGESNMARRPIQDIKGKLEQYPYNLYSQSIIEEGVSDEDGLKKLIDRIIKSVRDPKNKNPRALLLLPGNLHSYFGYAKDYLMENGIDIDKPDALVKIQEIEQGANPDFVAQFGFWFRILEYVRQGDKAEPSQELLNFIAAMVDSDADPRAILNELFKTILKIRRIDWHTVDEQRRAWEAVAAAL